MIADVKETFTEQIHYRDGKRGVPNRELGTIERIDGNRRMEIGVTRAVRSAHLHRRRR